MPNNQKTPLPKITLLAETTWVIRMTPIPNSTGRLMPDGKGGVKPNTDMRVRYLDGPSFLNLSPVHGLIVQTWESAEAWMQWAAAKWDGLYTAEVVSLYVATTEPQK